MILRRLTVALLLSGAATVLIAGPAFAHAELIASNPAKDASLPAAPTQIQLTFNEAVTPESITVTGPGGAQWTVGQAAVTGAGVITAPVQPSGPAGAYALAYRVRSADGDPVSGTVNFTVAVAAQPNPTTPTTAGEPPSPQPAPGSAGRGPSVANPSGAPPAPAAQQTGSDDGGVPAWVWVLIAVVALALIAGGVLLARRSRDKAPS